MAWMNLTKPRKSFALLASSRPLQASFSVAQPMLASFLAVGGIPQLPLLVLLFVGSLAGMFSVFSLNDLLDYGIDKKSLGEKKEKGWDIDSVFAQHPLTSGLITFKEQAAWIAATGALAAGILYILSPLALGLYLLAILLEAGYCRLATVSELKTLLAGMLVAVGALIGWFAAGGSQNLQVLPLCLLFFAWEIGGRNIPNDFSDIRQDKKIGIKTVPSVHGEAVSANLIAIFSFLTVLASIWVGASLGPVFIAIVLVVGLISLILPAWSLMKKPVPSEALSYFNKASLYPVFLFLAALIYLAAR